MQENNDGKTQMSEEEYLRKHLEKVESNAGYKPQPKAPSLTVPTNSRTVDLQYQAFDVTNFPCGKFYPTGTTIQIRPALVHEIQAYSMVDENNFADVVDKMNDMLMACVRIKYSNGDISNYLEIKEQDRIYILFLIRELTFQQGKYLTVNKTCQCKNELQIELKRENFIFFKTIPKLENLFDEYNKVFALDFYGEEFNLSMPNIGLQKSFTDYIIEEYKLKKEPNLSFLKIMPYLLGNITYIDSKRIKEELKKFQSMGIESFQFINSAIEYMKFGIEQLRKECPVCQAEVRTEMTFPNGPAGIFVVRDTFERYFQE